MFIVLHKEGETTRLQAGSAQFSKVESLIFGGKLPNLNKWSSCNCEAPTWRFLQESEQELEYRRISVETLDFSPWSSFSWNSKDQEQVGGGGVRNQPGGFSDTHEHRDGSRVWSSRGSCRGCSKARKVSKTYFQTHFFGSLLFQDGHHVQSYFCVVVIWKKNNLFNL